MNEKTRRVAIVVAAILGCAALLYLGGLLGQLFTNYNTWLSAGGMMGKAQMQSPDWKQILLELLFDDSEFAGVGATFGYDAIRDGAYVLSFLDSDIFRLHAFWDTVRVQKYKATVICFPEQVPFLRSYLRGKVDLQTVTMDMVENAIMEGSDSNE